MTPILDNPLYGGLALSHGELLKTYPSDWIKNYKTWQPKLLKPTWSPPQVTTVQMKFTDFPCVNMMYPAFSQRAVDLLGNVLAANGELLPINHKEGISYFYNCTKMVNCLDLEKTKVTKLNGGLITSTMDPLVFIEEMLQDLTVFKIRTQLTELFCSQTFVDLVNHCGLQGFSFIRIWPMPPGSTYRKERSKASTESGKQRPFGKLNLDASGNTVSLRLYTVTDKITKKEFDLANEIMALLEQKLDISDFSEFDTYYGHVEAYDIVDKEFRIIISCPDCEVLLARLMPIFRTLPWKGTFDVTKSHYPFTPIIYPDEDENVENVEIL